MGNAEFISSTVGPLLSYLPLNPKLLNLINSLTRNPKLLNPKRPPQQYLGPFELGRLGAPRAALLQTLSLPQGQEVVDEAAEDLSAKISGAGEGCRGP